MSNLHHRMLSRRRCNCELGINVPFVPQLRERRPNSGLRKPAPPQSKRFLSNPSAVATLQKDLLINKLNEGRLREFYCFDDKVRRFW